MKFQENKIIIEPYSKHHLKEVISIYRLVFAQSPWDEYKLCMQCDIKYGIEDAYPGVCKECNKELVDFWPEKLVKSNLEKVIKKDYSKIFLAKNNNNNILGFIYGFKGLPEGDYSSLEKEISNQSFYVNELAVYPSQQRKGIGTSLLNEIILKSRENHDLIYLRTDPQNRSAMNFYEKAGFIPLNYKDPNFFDRIYLARSL